MVVCAWGLELADELKLSGATSSLLHQVRIYSCSEMS